MLNLAIECSGIFGSVALYWENTQVEALTLPTNVTSVQTLAAGVKTLLARQADRPVELISVSVGPGSFTGLRGGIASAKMLSFAWKVPIAPVDTLHAIAHRLVCQSQFTQPMLVLPVVNAFRKQVFAAAWTADPSGQLGRCVDSQVLEAFQWQLTLTNSFSIAELSQLAQVRQTDQRQIIRCIATGPGLRAYPFQNFPRVASNQLPQEFIFEVADEAVWDPTATDVALLGWQQFQAGMAVSATELLPNYVRPSAAEEQQRASQRGQS